MISQNRSSPGIKDRKMRDIKRHTIIRITTAEAADEIRPTSHRSPGHCMLLYATCVCRIVRSLPGDTVMGRETL